MLVERAQSLSAGEGISLAAALSRVERTLGDENRRVREVDPEARQWLFICDAGLGGLARWLRAAGHPALWRPDTDDEAVIAQAIQTSATVLTTDSIMMERKVFRDKIIRSLWLPPSFGIAEQLRLVFREFHLSLREPRCMSCGGELKPRPKESLKDRIPPRTYLWLDEYFVCADCGKLFWKGTHWERIEQDSRSGL